MSTRQHWLRPAELTQPTKAYAYRSVVALAWLTFHSGQHRPCGGFHDEKQRELDQIVTRNALDPVTQSTAYRLLSQRAELSGGCSAYVFCCPVIDAEYAGCDTGGRTPQIAVSEGSDASYCRTFSLSPQPSRLPGRSAREAGEKLSVLDTLPTVLRNNANGQGKSVR
jgi:hypothetical protein